MFLLFIHSHGLNDSDYNVKYLLLTLSYLNIPICDNNRYRYIRIKYEYEYTIRDFFNFYNFIMCVWVCVTSPITGPVNRHVQHWWIRKYGMAAKCLYRLKCEHYLIVFKGQYYRYLILVVPASGWRIRDPDLLFLESWKLCGYDRIQILHP